MILGPNALRALSELGLLEAVQARAEQPKPAARRFRFLYGSGDHEVIYDVSPDVFIIFSFFVT